MTQTTVETPAIDLAHVSQIAAELRIKPDQVRATAELLADGATVPFIARYRKEATGSLDEVAITSIRDRLAQLAELRDRRLAIIKSLAERELLTEELEAKIQSAKTLAELEDIYLPYRPKRRTRATIAREKGLEPLADILIAQVATDLESEALPFVDPEKGVESVADALAGAADIVAERISEDQEARGKMRRLYLTRSSLRSSVAPEGEEGGAKYATTSSGRSLPFVRRHTGFSRCSVARGRAS